jgi:hypothetical protein
MDELEDKLMQEILKPFQPSGHAFVCFNSIQSVNLVQQHFKMTPKRFFQILCIQFKEKFTGLRGQRDRVHSTFD